MAKPGTFEKVGDGVTVGLGWLMILSVAMCFGFIVMLIILALLESLVN
jgi:hypothetical protein